MSNAMKLDECFKCEHHVEYRDGFVMCRFWKQKEQRMTQVIDTITYLINCPKNEGGKMSA